MVLVLMLLLAGCGGGPSEAEGAEPSATPPSAGVQTTESNGQETQEPQAPETSRNGTTVENVSRASIFGNSAAGYILMTSTTEVDKIMIINVDAGEIVSEFQAHLTK